MSQKIRKQSLTFDDVLLVPRYSDVLPRGASTRSRLTSSIPLALPILSSAMDTVTESRMAIAMALDGGLGIIHKNMSIGAQADEVRKVKRSQSGLIVSPLYLRVGDSTKDAMHIMREHSIGGIPIVDEGERLVGIVTHRDLRLVGNETMPLTEIMTRDLITLNEGDNLQSAERLLSEHKIEKLPVVDKQKRLKGLVTYKDILKKKNKPHASQDAYGRLRVGAALGTDGDTLARAEALVEAGVDILCIDTAHGHSELVKKTYMALRRAHSKTPFIVGNVATRDAALFWRKLDIDALKVGVGPGSICTTRVIAGVGVPQLSAIMEVSEALKGTSITLIADGGIRSSGDIVKAIAAGADTIMVGSMLAGTEEAPGEVILLQGKKYKTYRGMGSIEVLRKGSKDRYFQHAAQSDKLVPEGIVGRVPYRGYVSEVLFQLQGGIRAAMGYCGAKDIDTLKKEAQFDQITSASMIESHPHDVTITQEAPNYSI